MQAVTFVSRRDSDSYLEHHLSYYPRSKTYAATPGHAGAPEPGVQYRIFSPGSEILRCFSCHSTGPLSLDADNRIQPSENGVRCEACHGPGSIHAAAPSKDNIIQPGRYTAGELNQFCGNCHRKPAAAGEDTDWTNPWNARHQPLYLAESRCFLQSRGKLNCLTCHNAHTGQTKTDCQSCHARPKHTATVAVAGKNCVTCHMPAVKPSELLRFTNHWIGVYRAGATLRPRR